MQQQILDAIISVFGSIYFPIVSVLLFAFESDILLSKDFILSFELLLASGSGGGFGGPFIEKSPFVSFICLFNGNAALLMGLNTVSGFNPNISEFSRQNSSLVRSIHSGNTTW